MVGYLIKVECGSQATGVFANTKIGAKAKTVFSDTSLMAHAQQIDLAGNGQRELGHPNHTDLADGKLKSVLLVYAINAHTKMHAPSKNGPRTLYLKRYRRQPE